MVLLSRLREELWEDRLNEKRPASAWVRQLFTASLLPLILVWELVRFIAEPMHLAFLWCTVLLVLLVLAAVYGVPCEVEALWTDRLPCHLQGEMMFQPSGG